MCYCCKENTIRISMMVVSGLIIVSISRLCSNMNLCDILRLP